MRFIALIPARLASTRLSNKLLCQIGNQSVIATTYHNAVASCLFDEVIVVTDSQEIAADLDRYNAQYILDEKHYECGTDRIAAVADRFHADDIIINIQGDEPFLNHQALAAIKQAFLNDSDFQIDAASLMHELHEEAAIQNPNNVKVVTNVKDMAVLFSRAPIPFVRDTAIPFLYYKHIGIYAFRMPVLQQFAALAPHYLELVEKLEGNRFIAYGLNLKMIITDKPSIGIDTQEDLDAARILITAL